MLSSAIVNKLLSFAAFLCLAAPCFGEIRFDWQEFDKIREVAKDTPFDAKVDIAFFEYNRSDLVKAVKNAALKFTEQKYGERGAYNFLTSQTKFIVRFEDLRGLGGTYSAAKENYENKNLVILDRKLTKNIPTLKIFALHEFSHAYDDMYPEISSCGVNCHTEQRAQIKEELFIQELKNEIPADLYQRYMQRYKYPGAADIRHSVLLELMER